MSYTDSEQILKNSKLWTDSEFFTVADAVRVINSIRRMEVKKNSTAQMLSRMVQDGELDKPEKNSYIRKSRSREWLCKSWRTKTNEELWEQE